MIDESPNTTRRIRFNAPRALAALLVVGGLMALYGTGLPDAVAQHVIADDDLYGVAKLCVFCITGVGIVRLIVR